MLSVDVQTSVPTTLIHIAPAQVGVRPVSHSAIPPLAVVSKDGPERVGPWPDYLVLCLIITCTMSVVKLSKSYGSLQGLTFSHLCLKSRESGFARAIVPYLKNLDVLTPRIDAKKITHYTL